jgi:drug/metabolite transporter (DMT)-like permease
MIRHSSRASLGATFLFVLLWSSGGIVARLGIDHASVLDLLALRYAIALAVLAILARARRRSLLPAPGTRLRVAASGSLLVGAYSICYFQSLDHHISPGVLATVLGAQPVLTLVITERRFSPARLLGLCLALCGLALVVHDGATLDQFSIAGMTFAFASLAAMTAGTILLKSVPQPPTAVLPLQYATSLVICLAGLPFQPHQLDGSVAFLITVLWLALVISVVAQLLLYRLIHAGNLVNVTSLFYLVPIGTAILDRVILGNPLSTAAVAGMAAILAGLAVAFGSLRLRGRGGAAIGDSSPTRGTDRSGSARRRPPRGR